jgi:hypothetical protein
MSGIPKVRRIDVASKLADVATSHQAIQAKIVSHAATHHVEVTARRETLKTRLALSEGLKDATTPV